MGVKGSSSKTKLSKRKRDKISSQKKSWRKESKKRIRSDDESSNSEHYSSSVSKSGHKRRINKKKKLRRDYSLSSSSDHRSMSSSDSDSLSDSYKRKKTRRPRVSLKSAKRKARKRSSVSNDGRKRKRSSRDRVKSKIKKSSKKKYKKYSSSSSSSDSDSCPTCPSLSISSSEDNNRKKRKIILDESHESHKKRKIRSPSCSSFDRLSNDDFSVSHSDGALLPVFNTNSRRLRSVITVADQRYDEEENRWEDPHKEEIVYDQNDYPSPKSPDSNEGENKMELENSKSVGLENFADEEVAINPKSRINEGNQDNAENKSEKGKEIDDLESILRQKALENLRKFKEKLQTCPTSSTNLKMNNESNVNKSFDQTVDDCVQKESTNQVSSNARETNPNGGLLQKSEISQLTEVKKLSDSEIVEKELRLATQTSVGPPDGTAVLGCLKEDKDDSSNAVSAKPVINSETCTPIGEPSASVGTVSGENSLERGNEAKDGSQFEQKTMSVMRGGEMVQVSYKVYIPKKAPAVTRRQLRR